MQRSLHLIAAEGSAFYAAQGRHQLGTDAVVHLAQQTLPLVRTRGLALTLALGRLLSNLLFGVSAFDPVILALVCGILLAVALFATGIPAWRAARIDPLNALRRD